GAGDATAEHIRVETYVALRYCAPRSRRAPEVPRISPWTLTPFMTNLKHKKSGRCTQLVQPLPRCRYSQSFHRFKTSGVPGVDPVQSLLCIVNDLLFQLPGLFAWI